MPPLYYKAGTLIIIIRADFLQRFIVVVIAASLKLKSIGNDRAVNISLGIKIDIRIRGVDNSCELALGLDVEELFVLACSIYL